MYQKFENFVTKKEKVKEEKDVSIYIWKGSKIHFRGPCEFKASDPIDVFIDNENRKLVFVKTTEPSKYSKKLTIFGKNESKMFSFKKVLQLVEFTGTATFKANKLDKEALASLGIDGELGYEIDINNPTK